VPTITVPPVAFTAGPAFTTIPPTLTVLPVAENPPEPTTTVYEVPGVTDILFL
jgi:hypothetical protein